MMSIFASDARELPLMLPLLSVLAPNFSLSSWSSLMQPKDDWAEEEVEAGEQLAGLTGEGLVVVFTCTLAPSNVL